MKQANTVTARYQGTETVSPKASTGAPVYVVDLSDYRSDDVKAILRTLAMWEAK